MTLRRLLLNASLGALAVPPIAWLIDSSFLLPSFVVPVAIHAVAALGTFRPSSRIWGDVVRTFHTSSNEVWLTIDDGPADDTPEFLEILARHGALSTFFVIGEKAAQHEPLLQRVNSEGHGIACHTHSHPSGWFWAYGRSAARREIERCNEVIARVTGRPSSLFRAPVGFRNGYLHDVLEELGMILVGWSARGYDGLPGAAERVAERLSKSIAPGSILLIHQGRRESRRILELVLAEIDRRGLRCVIPHHESLRAQTTR